MPNQLDCSTPRSKMCEWCGREFSRDERKHPYTNQGWRAKRFCGRDCANQSKSATLRSASMEQHPGWKGDAVAEDTARSRARRMYPTPASCSRCGHVTDEGEWPIERHHRNENILDNRPENIEFLCRTCHKRHHMGLAA